MLFGLAGPFMLRLSTAGAGLLGVSVAVAGLIAAVAIAPADRPIAWGRVLLVTGGWCLGWLWSGTVAWPIAFWLVADRYVNTFDAIMGSVPFVNLAAGPVLSGIAGGVLGYVLQRRRLA